VLDKSCKEFVEVLASSAPVPGGGGAAAFGGAIGMALSNMVGNLTVGKKKYADVEAEVKDLLAKGSRIIEEFERLVSRDAEVFEPLSKAYGIPKDDPKRAETLEKCAIQACSVPMEIMRKAAEGLRVANRMAQIGSALAVSDAGCAAAFLKAALVAGSLNVVINLNIIKDEAFLAQARREMAELMAEGTKLADETLALVMKKLGA